MVILRGKSVSGGICFGQIMFFEREKATVKRSHIEDAESEIKRYETARDIAISQLCELFEKAEREIGPLEAQIFSIHQMMLCDEDYNESVKNIIKIQKLNSESAVLMTSEIFADMFLNTDDQYMQSRATDVCDISERVISILSGEEQSAHKVLDNTIIFSDDLAPSETLSMDKSKISAFVTVKGSTNSHTAILARALNIPAIIGVSGAMCREFNNKPACIDGYEGKIYIEPDCETIKRLEKIKKEKEALSELLKELKNKPTITPDGRKINLYANIASPSQAGDVILNDAEGIGLYRSEFLYLENKDFPSEDAQFEAYLAATRPMGEKPVIIRTLDIGADKKIDYFNLPLEENPALGMRAIRICLKNPDIFKTQLRAILRASAFGNVMIMFPMIVSQEEVLEAKKLLLDAKAELRAENIPFREDIKVGIMIETPASVMISDVLAKEVDFFSIGTNDLSQYLLAMDRQNDSLSDMFNPYHEAIFKSIEFVIKNAHASGIWAGVCGELASDPQAVLRLCEMGIDELSVSPQKILEVRKLIIDGRQLD